MSHNLGFVLGNSFIELISTGMNQAESLWRWRKALKTDHLRMAGGSVMILERDETQKTLLFQDSVVSGDDSYCLTQGLKWTDLCN